MIQVLVESKMETFTSAKEVILAAGAFNTHKLLELLGVGSTALLERLGILVQVDIPGVSEEF